MTRLATHKVGAWLWVSDGQITIISGKVDIGQRISTALMLIVQEELTLNTALMSVAPVQTDRAPDEGITSGSKSIEDTGAVVRQAAATLRQAARALLPQNGALWALQNGQFCSPDGTQKIDILDLITKLDPQLPIDAAAAFLPRDYGAASPFMRDLDQMVRGRFCYLPDIDVPNMQHARLVRPPHSHARLDAIELQILTKMAEEKVRVVRDGSFLAVVSPDEWAVETAAKRVARACTWVSDKTLEIKDIFESLTENNAKKIRVIDGIPDPKAPLVALKDLPYRARFEKPYLAHGSLAPSAAFAHWSQMGLKLCSHSQGIYPLRASIAQSLGLALEQVQITHVPSSGCYGHNGADDAAMDAALIAKHCPNVPILLKWTRQDEQQWEPFGSAMVVELGMALDPDQKISDFHAQVYSDTHRGRPRPDGAQGGPARLLANRLRADPLAPYVPLLNMNPQGGMHRNIDPIYQIGQKIIVKNLVQDLPLRTSAVRCLGGGANMFAIESLMDEVARDQGVDPLAFRRAQLHDLRSLAVLDALKTELSTRPTPSGQMPGRGMAFGQYKNKMTRTAISVDIDLREDGQILLKDVIIVADAGRIIDRDGLAAQLEGGFLQGASWALYEEVSWSAQGLLSQDWDSYPVIRFDNIPEMKLVLLEPSDAPSVGAGEATPGPAIAAIANALFDATGLRLRRLPFRPDRVLKAALGD